MGDLEPIGPIITRHTNQRKAKGKVAPSAIPHERTPEGYSPKPNSRCPYCDGAGYVYPNVPMDDPKRGKSIPCQAPGCYADNTRNKETKRAELAGEVGLLQTFGSFTVDPSNTNAYEAALAIADDVAGCPPWLLISGQSGNGKTHLLRAIYCRAQKNGRGVIYQTVANALSEYKSWIGAGRGDEWLRMTKLTSFLIWDDYGAHRGTEFDESSLHEILDYRYEKRQTTVVSSNWRIEDFPVRLKSRFSDKARCVYVVNRCEDRRPIQPSQSELGL